MFTLVALWLAFAFVAGIIASKKGRSGPGFFLLAVLLSPLVGILGAVAAKADRAQLETNQVASGEGKKCPYCAEVIKPEAVACRYCGRDLPKTPTSDVSTPTQSDELQPLTAPPMSKLVLVPVFLLIALAVIVVVVLLLQSSTTATTSEHSVTTQPETAVSDSANDRWLRQQIELVRAREELRELPTSAHARRVKVLETIMELDPADRDAAAQLQAEQGRPAATPRITTASK